jgi:hypothetical protein
MEKLKNLQVEKSKSIGIFTKTFLRQIEDNPALLSEATFDSKFIDFTKNVLLLKKNDQASSPNSLVNQELIENIATFSESNIQNQGFQSSYTLSIVIDGFIDYFQPKTNRHFDEFKQKFPILY